MTSLHGAIRALLVADTAVLALVSTRIYPMVLPLDVTLPAISIHEVSGAENAITGHGYPRYQISCWASGASGFSQVQSMKDAVKDCLNRYKGVASGNHIKQITFLGSLDDYETETKVYHIPLDFQVIHYTT